MRWQHDDGPCDVCGMTGQGTAPALLARRSEERHGGTGVVYTMSTTATQLGFLCVSCVSLCTHNDFVAKFRHGWHCLFVCRDRSVARQLCLLTTSGR